MFCIVFVYTKSKPESPLLECEQLMNENKNFYKYYARFDYLQVFNERSNKN